MSYKKIINNMTFSFSRIHSYETCPYLFYLKYIEKRDGESNYYAANGKCMHEVFEQVLTGTIPIEECTQLYIEKYDQICETTKRSTMDKTFETCLDYLCEMDDVDRDRYEIIGVEIKLEFKVGKYKFQGFADLVVKDKLNGEVILVDHKQATHFLKNNGEPLANQRENFLAYKKQMYMYCKGLKDQLGIQVDKMVWNHFKDSGRTTQILFEQEELDETLEWAVELIEKIKKDKKFECSRSYMMCNVLCDYRNDCEYKDEE